MYKKEIEKIKGTTFDLAFVPLDSRQGEQYYLGFDTFMQNTNTKVAFPMHFWEKPSVIGLLLESDHSISYRYKVVKINKDNEEFEII
ncbi:hypothetical protein [Romboutsia sp.]|uniref:hypothetical protein n=1 Tax=Romboutsia sp. TaxID=1965302 RepID=UPI003F3411B1